jgi:FdrA protein
VLGFGSNMNPAAELVPALKAAQAVAKDNGRAFICVGHICGTQGDPQGFEAQAQALQDAGMVLADSNAQAVRLAYNIVKQAAA